MEIGPGWDDALRAWKRLSKRLANPAPPDSGGLAALSDISVVRRQLEHIELAAVQAARRDGKSWAEIATNLGVTRQSAWERWRDLDEQSTPVEIVTRAVEEVARARRGKRSELEQVKVPDVIGMSCSEATTILFGAGFVPLAHNAGGDPVPLATVRSGRVTDQVPKAGVERRPGSSVTVWYDQGDAGVREPRRPTPPLREASAEADDDVATH